jgi:hypothetical protein
MNSNCRSTAGDETVSDLGSYEGMARTGGYTPWRIHSGRLIFPDFLLRQDFLWHRARRSSASSISLKVIGRSEICDPAGLDVCVAGRSVGMYAH